MLFIEFKCLLSDWKAMLFLVWWCCSVLYCLMLTLLCLCPKAVLVWVYRCAFLVVRNESWSTSPNRLPTYCISLPFSLSLSLFSPPPLSLNLLFTPSLISFLCLPNCESGCDWTNLSTDTRIQNMAPLYYTVCVCLCVCGVFLFFFSSFSFLNPGRRDWDQCGST